MMPNVNPRTNLTLKPELHDLIQETADHLGLKRSINYKSFRGICSSA